MRALAGAVGSPAVGCCRRSSVAVGPAAPTQASWGSHAPLDPRPHPPARAPPAAALAARLRARRARGCAPLCAAEGEGPTTPTAVPKPPKPPKLDLRFDNAVSDAGTVVQLVGEDSEGLLAKMLAAFASLQLTMVQANIRTTADGAVRDTFVIKNARGDKLSEEVIPVIKEHVLTSLRHGEGKSGQPLIYGVSAALEVAALKARRKQQEDQGSLPSGQAAPKTRVGALGLQDAEALELAAAEMALAASSLVAAEKASTEAADAALAACDGDGAACDNAAALAQLEVMERAREEAALVLERRMAAMEAAIASRRSPKETIAEKLRQQREREMLEGFGFRAAEDGLAGGQQAGTGPGMGNGYEIILQGFQWDSHALKPSWYAHLGSRAEAISASGFTAVWLPPATNSVSEQGYLPRDLYDLNSGYGTEGALRGVLQKLKELRVKCVADIVINHRCAHTQKDGKWNQFGGRLAWDESAICQGNPAFGGTGARNTGEPYPAAPNIDHTNPKVRASLTEWLLWMRMVGFDGWRFDYVKGYSGEFTKNYVDASVPQLAFGEYWDACNYTGGVLDYNQDSHRQRTVNWCDRTGGTAAAFDFTTKGILQEAVGRSEYWRLVDSQGRMPGFAGLWGARAVTFVENHDTGPPLAHWPFPQLELAQGYAYILTHPGTPCVFWDHWDASKQPGLSDIICQLISVRKRARIHAKSTVVVLKASGECYAACIDGKVVVKLGWGDFSPNTIKLEGKHWERACNGRNFAVWTQDSVPKALSLLAAIGSAPMAGTAGR